MLLALGKYLRITIKTPFCLISAQIMVGITQSTVPLFPQRALHVSVGMGSLR